MGTCKFGVTRFAVPHLLTLYSFEFPRYFEGNPSGAHTFFFLHIYCFLLICSWVKRCMNSDRTLLCILQINEHFYKPGLCDGKTLKDSFILFDSLSH